MSHVATLQAVTGRNLPVTQLAPALGAIVKDIDLSAPLSDALKQEIYELLLAHQVLFFRKQDLTPMAQRDLARYFGQLHIHPVYPTVENVPEVIVLDTARNDLRDNALWHTDVTFSPTPPLGAILAARLLPATGGDTLWASSTAAYEALSEGMKKRLENLTALHDFTRSFPLSRFGRNAEEREKWLKIRNDHPPVEHPVIRIHPDTGARGIFVSEGFTTEICDIGPEEGTALLQFLFRHTTRPEFSIRWRWEEGDVAFWDNRITSHYAVDDYRPARRVMNRVTILGDRPYGPV